MKLNARALGFAAGVLWGGVVFLVTLLTIYSNWSYGVRFLGVVQSVYPGYRMCLSGAVLGLCYGFVDGFIGGWLLAVLYNFFSKDK